MDSDTNTQLLDDTPFQVTNIQRNGPLYQTSASCRNLPRNSSLGWNDMTSQGLPQTFELQAGGFFCCWTK